MGGRKQKGETNLSVPKGKRKESKIDYDATYFRVYDDCINLINLKFGGSHQPLYQDYINVMSQEVLISVMEIGRQIRIANSIYPTCNAEKDERRICQDRAIGLCFDLLTKYQLIMHTLKVADNKYCNEIKNLIHEINCLKSWRSSDNKRFNNLG